MTRTPSRLNMLLTNVVTDQACGEWTDKIIIDDVVKFEEALKPLIQDVIDDLRQRGDACHDLSKHSVHDVEAWTRLHAKGSTYHHAADLVLGLIA